MENAIFFLAARSFNHVPPGEGHGAGPGLRDQFRRPPEFTEWGAGRQMSGDLRVAEH